jgi:hypothetical protein
VRLGASFAKVSATSLGQTNQKVARCVRAPGWNIHLLCGLRARANVGRKELKMLKISEEKKLLPCVLTEYEVTERGRLLSGVVKDLEEIQEEKKQANARFKARIDSVTNEVQRLATVVKSGIESRMITVSNRLNAKDKTVESIRMDTGEVIYVRPATAHELQIELFDNEVLQ